jgi:hypothetical protein
MGLSRRLAAASHRTEQEFGRKSSEIFLKVADEGVWVWVRQFSYLTRTTYLSTTIPTAISIAIRTLQRVESARRAGDFHLTREAMFVDGIGT